MNKPLLPKILIVSRSNWDDTRGTSSTLSNIFRNYDSERLAMIYIETIQPNTNCCHLFFQISEYSLIRKFFCLRQKTGHIIDTREKDCYQSDSQLAKQEATAMNYVRGHRSAFYSTLREVLWAFNGWKSKELKHFITDFAPDLVWLDGNPLPLMNRLQRYVLDIANKPASIFMQDDVYTYKSCGNGVYDRIRKWILRRKVRRVVEKCDNMFVASPKMKTEYDQIFGVDSTFITKGIDFQCQQWIPYNVHNPIRLVYMGQVLYGRIYSLIHFANALEEINRDEVKMELHIYTNNQIPDNIKQQLLRGNSVKLMNDVPYTEVPNVISNSDIVVFVESFDKRFCNVARLSFSTKITDYFASGRSIFAIGPSDSAPIEFLRENDVAFTATSIESMKQQLKEILAPPTILEYAQKSYNYAMINHNKDIMNKIIFGRLFDVINVSSELRDYFS